MWATSKHDVYLMSNFLVTHYSSLTSGKNEVLNVQGHVAPSEVSVFFQNVKFYFNVTILLCDYKLFCLFVCLVHLETSWKFAGRVYADSSEYTCSKRRLFGCWWISRRAYLQG